MRGVLEIIKNIFVRSVCLIVIVLVVMGTASCSHRHVRCYYESPFRAEIKWTVEDTEYLASVTADSPEGSERSISLEFHAPERLNGFVACRSSEGIKLFYDGFSVDIHNGAILGAAELVAAVGSFSYVGRAELDGREVTVAERTEDSRRTTLYLDSESGAPLALTADGLDVSVVWFEYLS